MFLDDRKTPQFDWGMIGDVEQGRPNLGTSMDVSVYRLFQFTLRDAIIARFDPETAKELFYDAGFTAGSEIFKQLLSGDDEFSVFIGKLAKLLLELKIGVLRVEKADLEARQFIITVSEDLDCSGLPAVGERICTYDEGFIAGLFKEYTGWDVEVVEKDCWCSGDTICRFDIRKV